MEANFSNVKEHANPYCPTCNGGGIVDIDDMIVSMHPIYALCPGCLNRGGRTATGKPIDVPWTPKANDIHNHS